MVKLTEALARRSTPLRVKMSTDEIHLASTVCKKCPKAPRYRLLESKDDNRVGHVNKWTCFTGIEQPSNLVLPVRFLN